MSFSGTIPFPLCCSAPATLPPPVDHQTAFFPDSRKWIREEPHETIYKYPESPDDIPLVVDNDGAIELTIGTILSELLKYGSYQFVFILNGANEYAPIYTQNIFDISIVQKRVSNNRESISNGEEEDDYDIHLILDGGEESLMGIDCDCLFGQ